MNGNEGVLSSVDFTVSLPTAVTNFSNGRGISPEPVHSKRDAKAMAKLKMKVLHEFSNGRSHHRQEPPIENRRKIGRIGTLTRNKIFAVNSFKNGREITEYVEVSDSEVESSDAEQFSDENEKIIQKIDDQKQMSKPKDDGDIEISKTNEVKEVNNTQTEETDRKEVNHTQMEETEKQIVDNIPTLEVNY